MLTKDHQTIMLDHLIFMIFDSNRENRDCRLGVI